MDEVTNRPYGPRMQTFDWADLHELRRDITDAEARLEGLYRRRWDLIATMVGSGMGQREVGAYWDVSQARINQVLKKLRKTKENDGT